MEIYSYACDGGAIKIGNDSFNICICNNIGDGVHDFYVLDIGEKIPMDDFHFIGSCEGITNIYYYDCGYSVVCTIKGKFGISCKRNGGTFVFQKWDDLDDDYFYEDENDDDE